MRILILVHESLVPPQNAFNKIQSLENIKDRKFFDWEVEFDVGRNLQKLGHIIEYCGCYDDIFKVEESIKKFKPHLVFNLLEEFHGETQFDQHVVSFLEILGIPYTGANPKSLTLARDKALTKKILKFHNIKTPNFVEIEKNLPISLDEIQFPCIVKYGEEQGSLHLSQKSIVKNEKELHQRLKFLQSKNRGKIIVENYIHGREFVVGVLGSKSPLVLPVIEIDFGKLQDGSYPIQSRKAKFDVGFQKRNGIDLKIAKLPDNLKKDIIQITKKVYRCLFFTGYARIDFRLTNQNEFFVLEVNANPDISDDGELGIAFNELKLSYPQMLQKIIQNALKVRSNRNLPHLSL